MIVTTTKKTKHVAASTNRTTKTTKRILGGKWQDLKWAKQM